jgi:hypothetical protein
MFFGLHASRLNDLGNPKISGTVSVEMISTEHLREQEKVNIFINSCLSV